MTFSIYLWIFLASLFGALIGTPIIRKIALKFNIVDLPSGRKIHLEPIPLLGGFVIAIVFLLVFSLFSKPSGEIIAVILSSILIILVGLIDDIRGFPPFLKLSFQILATWLIIIFGTSISFTNNPNIDIPFTFLWVVGITNAFNLLDNMDGLSVGIAGIASFFFFVLSAIGGQYLVGSLSIALCGSCLGFLRYNFKPAKIFMGDTGSMFIGFILSIIGIKLRFSDDISFSWIIPIIILGIPIFDTTLVTISRMMRKAKVSEAAKDHTSHRLVAFGLTHIKAVLLLYTIGIILGLLSILLANFRIGYFIIPVFIIFFIGGIIFFETKEKESFKQA
ncbi:MAG: MraY family glycosyltransferase [bacterium]